jgi:hypothetical protein
MRTTKRVVWALVFLAGLGACSMLPGGGGDEFDPEYVPPGPITVRVTNHNWADVVIYAVRGSARTRLGQVTSMSNVLFDLPEMTSSGNDVRLYVDIIGSRAYFLTDVLLLSPGVEIRLWVENHLPASSWAVDFFEEFEEDVPPDSVPPTPADSVAPPGGDPPPESTPPTDT